MLNWFKKDNRSVPVSKVQSLINTVADVVVNASALTWNNVWGTIKHEQMHSGNSYQALKLSAVKCALDIYTGMVGTVPRRMYALESGTQKKLRIVSTTDHPASRLFSHYFHPELQSDDALLMIVYDMLMDGNAYFVREPDVQGRTARLYYIHPTRIPRGNIFRSTAGQEKLTSGRMAAKGELLYRIDTGLSSRDVASEPLLLSKADIVHFKNKVMDTEHHRGVGFVEASELSRDLYRASEEFGWRFYTRGIATQMFLTTDNRLAPEVLKRVEANFTDDPNAPLESIFKTRVLEQGLKPVHMGIPFQHLQFIETRAFSVEDIARGLNIPPVLLHSYMGTKAGDVSMSEAIALFIQTGIGPLLSRIAQQFKTECLPLSSQMLFGFEFEHLYLYRTVIGEFTTALRNLFEIGMIDRQYGAGLLGMHIDPNDPANNLRYLPVNLMTVQHSLHLEEGADLNNNMLEKQIEMQKQTNEGMVSAEEHESVQKQAEAKSSNGDKMDKSPSKDNIDKRIRNADERIKNAFTNVINGLKQYETRVLDQKKQSRPDDFETARTEFYAADGKFASMLNEQLDPWEDVLLGCSDISQYSPKQLVTAWLNNCSFPEGNNDVSI
jgi:HK97 family phage portal protein